MRRRDEETECGGERMNEADDKGGDMKEEGYDDLHHHYGDATTTKNQSPSCGSQPLRTHCPGKSLLSGGLAGHWGMPWEYARGVCQEGTPGGYARWVCQRG